MEPLLCARLCVNDEESSNEQDRYGLCPPGALLYPRIWERFK